MQLLFKRIVQKVANYFGFQISRVDREDYFRFQALLYRYIKKNGSIKFIQIGGCDGISFDPLYPVILRKPGAFEGVILEPVEDYFKELEVLYRDHPGIEPLRYAVHNTLKEASLYKFDPEFFHKLPACAKGIASFDKEHLQSVAGPDYIVSETAHCIKLEEIMNRFEMNPPDLLLIDTEGYDAEILLNIDFQKNKPPIIRFEHGVPNGMMERGQLDRILSMLYDEGYEVVVEYFDVTAYQRDLFLNWN